jgi:hypothetical protein
LRGLLTRDDAALDETLQQVDDRVAQLFETTLTTAAFSSEGRRRGQ